MCWVSTGGLSALKGVSSHLKKEAATRTCQFQAYGLGRNAAWEEWAEDGADREQLIEVMNYLSQGIPNVSLGTWKGEQGSERDGEGSKPVGDGRQFECSAGECV